MNKNFFYGFVCLLFLTVGCSDITDPQKLESKVFVAPWAEGEWVIQNDKGEKITITIYPDGSVLGSDNSIGSWFFVEEYLYLTWMDGWVDMIKKQDNHYEKFGYEPGTPTDMKATNQSEAIKIEKK